jgi:hypothetical protein
MIDDQIEASDLLQTKYVYIPNSAARRILAVMKAAAMKEEEDGKQYAEEEGN